MSVTTSANGQQLKTEVIQMTKNNIKQTVQSLIECHALHTMVSFDQTGLQANQVRVYQDSDLDREYFIITVKKERVNND